MIERKEYEELCGDQNYVFEDFFCCPLFPEMAFDAIDALRRADGCELGESGLKQGDDGDVVPILGEVESSVAIDRASLSNRNAGIRSRCEKSTNDIDVAYGGCRN